MKTVMFAAAMLACLSAAMAFNCPDDAHAFYHADVSTGCQVYHHCQNSELQTLTCPSGQAFSHVTSQCEDASTVDCIETMPEHSHHHHQHHHHHKRSVATDFNCPDDAHTFYHADVSTGCQVYHLCENSQLQTLMCPPGEAFNHATLQCEDASTVACIETMGEHAHHHHQQHHHHKRSVDLAFNCPADAHTFYHADVSTGCQVYHHCQNSELQTLTCPSGEAFNHVTLQCEDASTVDCIETMPEHSHHHHQYHHHHKRSAAVDFNCPDDAHTFYHADVSTGCQDPVSSKDVETNNSKLTPFIATSGGNVFTAEEYLIVIDGIVSLRTNEVRLAVSLNILSFFVLKIEYPQKAALTLEFIQRIFANINPDKGSKAPRMKGKRSNMIAKPVINLVNGLGDFESHFNL